MSAHTQHTQLPRRTSRCSVTQLPRSSRVEKPKSHHNSPKTMERRKTTTEPKLYATLDDHYKMMFAKQACQLASIVKSVVCSTNLRICCLSFATGMVVAHTVQKLWQRIRLLLPHYTKLHLQPQPSDLPRWNCHAHGV